MFTPASSSMPHRTACTAIPHMSHTCTAAPPALVILHAGGRGCKHTSNHSRPPVPLLYAQCRTLRYDQSAPPAATMCLYLSRWVAAAVPHIQHSVAAATVSHALAGQALPAINSVPTVKMTTVLATLRRKSLKTGACAIIAATPFCMAVGASHWASRQCYSTCVFVNKTEGVTSQ